MVAKRWRQCTTTSRHEHPSRPTYTPTHITHVHTKQFYMAHITNVELKNIYIYISLEYDIKE